MKEKVLIFTGTYEPGIKGGGPIQSVKNIVENLSYWYEFYIITLDRDIGDIEPYKDINVNEWNSINNVKIYYIENSKITFRNIQNIINSISPGSIYLNSFFSYKFSIIPVILYKQEKISPSKLILAPRGEFSPGALSLKRTKKNIYLNIIKLFGIYKNIYWHATNEEEKGYIMDNLGVNSKRIFKINNLTSDYSTINNTNKVEKKPGQLSIIFLSRIHPKKNLKFALNLLNEIKGEITFNIYGPVEDKKYWDECLEIIEKLPSNVNIIYHGIIEHRNTHNVFSKNDVFLFPTYGENYGHVISEALIAGCPVIISDQTPWRKLYEKHIGIDINLNNFGEFEKSVQTFVDMGNDDYVYWSNLAFNYAKEMSNQNDSIYSYYKLFS